MRVYGVCMRVYGMCVWGVCVRVERKVGSVLCIPTETAARVVRSTSGAGVPACTCATLCACACAGCHILTHGILLTLKLHTLTHGTLPHVAVLEEAIKTVFIGGIRPLRDEDLESVAKVARDMNVSAVWSGTSHAHAGLRGKRRGEPRSLAVCWLASCAVQFPGRKGAG